MVDHISAGNLGFFAVIVEKRNLRIYWPQMMDQDFSEDILQEDSQIAAQEDAAMITT